MTPARTYVSRFTDVLLLGRIDSPSSSSTRVAPRVARYFSVVHQSFPLIFHFPAPHFPACTTQAQVLISDNHVDVKLRDGLVVGDGGGAAGAGSAAMAAAATAAAGGQAGVTSYRARLLPFVDGGDLVDLLARQDTVSEERTSLKRRGTRRGWGGGQEGREQRRSGCEGGPDQIGAQARATAVDK